jgi:predicted small metal-binding protein
MTQALKKIECDPKCGFMIQSHDEKEALEIAKQHAIKAHDMKITDEELKDMMEDA